MFEWWGVQCSERNLAPSHPSAGFTLGRVSGGSIWCVPLWLGPPSSPLPQVYWGLKLRAGASCVAVAEILVGHGKCQRWARQPNGQQVPRPAKSRYLACVCGEQDEDPHLPLGILQGRLLESKGEFVLQWGGRAIWYRGEGGNRKPWESRRNWCFSSQNNLIIFKWLFLFGTELCGLQEGTNTAWSQASAAHWEKLGRNLGCNWRWDRLCPSE